MQYDKDMKKITYSLFALLLLGCGQSDNQCKNINNIKWANHEQSIKIYTNCIGDALNTPDNELVNIPDEKIDSMLYLSYIYLTDTAHYDWDTATKMLDVATKSMLSKCAAARENNSYQDRYNNYCYHKYSFVKGTYDTTPDPVKTIDDAMFVYQMSLPCVYMDMIRENENALNLIQAWFGSTRDLDIPHVCEGDLNGKFLDFEKFLGASAVEYLESLNPYGMIDGTIRFGYRTSNYHDLIYMLTYPTHFFKSDKIDDVSVRRVVFAEDDGEITENEEYMTDAYFHAPELEQQIYKNRAATRGYKKMISALETYYISELKMDTATAKKYARLSAAQILLQYIYQR